MTKGSRLRDLRTKSGYTLEEAGSLVGVSKQTLYKYENDIVTNIPSDKIETLANLYNASPAYIMGWKNADSKDTVEDVEDWTDDELEQIRQFKEFLKSKRK